MVNATVDNTPVTVLLSSNETYSPATGSVQKVTVAVEQREDLSIAQGATTETIVNANKGSGEPNVESPEIIITDTETLQVGSINTGSGVYISGFEVS